MLVRCDLLKRMACPMKTYFRLHGAKRIQKKFKMSITQNILLWNITNGKKYFLCLMTENSTIIW